ncbi:hypothetical protein B0T17DRAFT_507434 [Bombardia bombarda]|uniref:Uncharacterized protein n=1 Tax=Bombardia bombarda TaxID=252184 RepID=A0AA40CB14_9PEZI|nr:hypothetical protein B0T17DRAFT_507434 [Bombardia bombarda]
MCRPRCRPCRYYRWESFGTWTRKLRTFSCDDSVIVEHLIDEKWSHITPQTCPAFWHRRKPHVAEPYKCAFVRSEIVTKDHMVQRLKDYIKNWDLQLWSLVQRRHASRLAHRFHVAGSSVFLDSGILETPSNGKEVTLHYAANNAWAEVSTFLRHLNLDMAGYNKWIAGDVMPVVSLDQTKFNSWELSNNDLLGKHQVDCYTNLKSLESLELDGGDIRIPQGGLGAQNSGEHNAGEGDASGHNGGGPSLGGHIRRQRHNRRRLTECLFCAYLLGRSLHP